MPPSAAFGGVTGAPPGARIGQRLEGSPFDQSRFANVPSQSRFAARVSLGWLASALALVALVGGIGYGGFALLQNVQRVGFAPLPEAPEVAAEPPRVLAAEALGEALSRPDAGVYGADGVLAAVFAPDDEPPIQRRDGPISAIDPNQAGVFARAPARSVDPRSPGPLPEGTITAAEVDSADDAIALAAAHDEAVRRLALAVRSGAAGERIGAGSARVQLAAAGPEPRGARRGVAVHAIERTWIRVRDENRAVIFEGILEAGRNFELPPRIEGPELRTGNAGGLFLVVDGAPHGPVGKRGAVLGGISLAAAAIRERFPAAEGALEGIARPAGGVEQRAASLDTD
ncbi:DUF4115 domain-containing protein [Paralimibaculum aggregatum]|uniref:DUF4115 domain-containing protein n=1 Tax=Paralimibaculum aggregatum TaxID=3036245 RepID=UPI003DA058E9